MVEAAELTDIPRLVELGAMLHGASSYRDVTYSREKVGRTLAALIQGAGVVFVVRKKGEIVGGLAGSVTPYWFSDEVHGFDFSLFFDPASRNGIYTHQVVQAFVIWCRARGAKKIRMGITTGIAVEATAKFYRWMGFKDSGLLFEMEI